MAMWTSQHVSIAMIVTCNMVYVPDLYNLMSVMSPVATLDSRNKPNRE